LRALKAEVAGKMQEAVGRVRREAEEEKEEIKR
jgi:uncharacterized protein YjbJ (UPF0337 family)